MITTRWLIAFIIADFVFLPMFHVYGVPYKFGYLILLGFFVTSPPQRGLAFQLSITLGILALVTVVALIANWDSRGTSEVGDLFTIIATYLMAATAFVFGSRSGESALHYIPHVMLIYFTLNIVVIMFWGNLLGTAFGDLYGYMPDYLGTGSKLVRAGGLHQNPNISARFMSVLFLGLFIGVRYGVIRLQSPMTILALIVGLGLPFIVSSRSEMAVSFVITAALLWMTVKREGGGKQLLAILVAALILATATIRFAVPDISETATSRIENTISTLRNDPFNRTNGLARPVQVWTSEELWSDLSKSPIVGGAGDQVWYHNEWATILAMSGAVGMGLFLLVVLGVVRVHVIFLTPLFISAMTNSFIFSPQHFTLYMMLVGVAWRLKMHDSAARTRAPALRHAGVIGATESRFPLPNLSERSKQNAQETNG